MTALPIRQDYSPSELRRLAGREPDRRAALRLLAVANALEGMPRAEAARLAGMERQALRDAVLRFNAAGPAGLHDKPRSGRPERLSAGQQAALKAHVLRGPAPERDGVSAWRLVDLCAHVERRYGVRYSLWGLSCLLGRLPLSRQKARPSHPKGDTAAQAAFKKAAPRAAVRAGFETHRQDRATDPHALPRVGEATGQGQRRGSRHLRLAFGAHLGE